MTRPADPRGAARRGGTDAADLGYTVANDAPAKRKRWTFGPEPKPALPDLGCRLYQGQAAPLMFPYAGPVVYNRCPKHQPVGSIDLGPVLGHCPVCLAAEVRNG